MLKKITSQSGFFNPRIFATVVLFTIGAGLGLFSLASTPSSGTLSPGTPVLTYDAGPFNVANPSPLGLGQLDTGPRCNGQFPCDNYALTVTLPAGYHAANPNAAVKVTMSWIDTGSGQADYDLYIYKGVVGNTNGSMPADFQSASGANPEVASISPLADGTQQFSIKIVPFQPTQEIVHVRIELLPGSGGSGFPGFGGADPTTPGVPRYQIFVPPVGSSAEVGNGEFNIGFNPMTGHIFAMNRGPIWRLTPGEVQTPAKSECCEALWENKSAPSTNTGLDPILWTDQVSGRTFASNSTAGANAAFAFTDNFTPGLNDGDMWVPVSGSPPNGGADHQTIGSGPYPPALSALGNAVNHGETVYYCSQDIAGPAACQRSDNLGVNFVTVGGPPYDGTTGPGCGGLHGHLHVAPDGTAWMPVNQCNGSQGGVFSTTAGMPSVAAPTGWTQFTVPNAISQVNGADPSIAIDANNTIYYAYVNNEPVTTGNPPEGHARVAVGTLNTTTGVITWIRNVDLGASHGIVNAALIEAVGGSSGRAAVGFAGTDRPGDYQALSFPGKWYAFIATTYDGGVTWTTVNATPNDPVQSMTGIWQQGGGAQDRNLLDFNEITVDNKGRVLYGYSDGCVTTGCIAGTAPNDFTAHMRVARQFGGKPILAAFDPSPAEPVVPKPPCLSGTRDSSASHLTWKAPDNGGADITGYRILRGLTTGGETELLANTGNIKTTYNDTTADPSQAHYFYQVQAINAQGIGVQSNEIDLPIGVLPPVESRCILPGLTILTDPANDELDMVPGHDVRSLQIAEPFVGATPDKVFFTLKVQSLAAVPPDTRWPVTFNVGSPAVNYTVRMTNSPTDGATTGPIFQVGRTTTTTPPPAEPFVAADPASNFKPDGTITIVVPRSAIGNPAIGQSLSGFLTRIAANIAGSTITPDNMPDSLVPSGSYTIAGNNNCFPLLGVVSRKIHGTAGTFDIDLPLAGNPGIECRSGGGANAYTLVYTVDRNVALAGTATVTQGTATVATTTIGPNPNQVTVNLTGVSNAQHLIVSLSGVQGSDGVILNNLAARVDMLSGDTNADGAVNSGDVSQTKSQSGQAANSSNFREDLNTDGAINSGDISLVKSRSGTGLPAAPASNPVTPNQPPSRKHPGSHGVEN